VPTIRWGIFCGVAASCKHIFRLINWKPAPSHTQLYIIWRIDKSHHSLLKKVQLPAADNRRAGREYDGSCTSILNILCTPGCRDCLVEGEAEKVLPAARFLLTRLAAERAAGKRYWNPAQVSQRRDPGNKGGAVAGGGTVEITRGCGRVRLPVLLA
jgi:hypothetical protein